MPRWSFSILMLAAMLIGCGSRQRPSENAYVNATESAVRSELGKPTHEFAGHYGAPPANFTQRFPGEIKTLVFRKGNGDYYVSFERRPNGWIGISSSWLPTGSVF